MMEALVDRGSCVDCSQEPEYISSGIEGELAREVGGCENSKGNLSDGGPCSR